MIERRMMMEDQISEDSLSFPRIDAFKVSVTSIRRLLVEIRHHSLLFFLTFLGLLLDFHEIYTSHDLWQEKYQLLVLAAADSKISTPHTVFHHREHRTSNDQKEERFKEEDIQVSNFLTRNSQQQKAAKY